MPSPREIMRFDAKRDEIGVLAGSLVSFLPDPNIVLVSRQVRRPGSRKFTEIYSVYPVGQVEQPIDTLKLIMTTEPLVNIEPRENDCLIDIRPDTFPEEISFRKLWEQFILTRYHFLRQN